MSEVYVLFGASVVIGFLAIVTFLMANSLKRALDEKNKAVTEATRLKANSSAEAQAILNQAQQKAQEILQTSEIFSGQFKAGFQNALLEIVEEQKKIYMQIAQSAQSESNKVATSASAQITQQVAAEMQAFHNSVIAKAASVGDSLTKAANADYARVHAEIEAYKQQMMAKVDQTAMSIVEQTTKKVLGKALSRKDHEKLIMQALEEARKQNVL